MHQTTVHHPGGKINIELLLLSSTLNQLLSSLWADISTIHHLPPSQAVGNLQEQRLNSNANKAAFAITLHQQFYIPKQGSRKLNIKE